MDGALLAQASASCWRQLASATAESGSAVLHLLVTQSHSREDTRGPPAQQGGSGLYPARLPACHGHPTGKVLLAPLPQPAHVRVRTFVCSSFPKRVFCAFTAGAVGLPPLLQRCVRGHREGTLALPLWYSRFRGTQKKKVIAA